MVTTHRKDGEVMDKNYNEVFAKRLLYYIEALNMPQKELAKRMGVSEASVSNWTKGTKVPRADKVDKLCDIFGCNRSDLLEESTDPISPLIQKHLANYQKFSPDQQLLIDELIDTLQTEPHNSVKILEVMQRLLSSLDS